jgi:hypothetical protein
MLEKKRRDVLFITICIGMLILEISLEEFLNGPTIGELM